MCAAQPGCNLNGTKSPNWVFQNTDMSILFKFSDECISKSLYSELGLYIMIGLYWFVSVTAISKSDMMFVRLELFPLLAKLSFDKPPYVMGRLVLVETMGSMPVQKTTLAIGFHIAKLETSCDVWSMGWGTPALSFAITVAVVSAVN